MQETEIIQFSEMSQGSDKFAQVFCVHCEGEVGRVVVEQAVSTLGMDEDTEGRGQSPGLHF